MGKRNKGRTSAPDVTATPPLAALTEGQNIFSFVTPTEFVELPSKGRFYPPEHPLHNTDTVEIKHMTAKEEDILTSEALLRNGTVLDRLLNSVLIDRRIRPDQLLIGDKNALFIGVRETGFGPLYSTALNCSACGEHNEKEFSLEEKYIVECTLADDVSLEEDGTFLLKIPAYELTVGFRLLTGADEVRIAKTLDNRKKQKLNSTAVTQLLQSIIISVNGLDDPQSIMGFVDACPASLSRQIRSAYEAAMPNVKIFGDFTCDSCSHFERVEVPISIGFFWPEL